jgi:hypothetical protein
VRRSRSIPSTPRACGNLIGVLGVIVLLVASDLLGWISLPWGVVGHEGSTLLVTLNGLRLLRQVRRKDEGKPPTAFVAVSAKAAA